LIEKIKMIHGVEQYYFPKSMLDNYGRYCESYVRTLDEIIANPTLKELTPYSIFINELLFCEIAKEFTNEVEEHSCIPIEKNDFEKQMNWNLDLQNAYLDVYNPAAEYYYGYEVIDLLHLEYYYMVSNDKIIFLYFTLIRENQAG
jgi:hypothetical protein